MNPVPHLLESTFCAALVALLLAKWRSAPARTRHGVWLLASLKFLVPFAAIAAAGSSAATVLPQSLTAPMLWLGGSLPSWRIAVDSAAAATMTSDTGSLVPLSAWMAGAAAILCWRFTEWRACQTLARASVVLRQGREIDALRRLGVAATTNLTIRQSASACEPAVIGVLAPAIVWPAGLSDRLTDSELDAVLAHELLHVRRRDNLTAAVQTIVEILVWFHPLVWWLSARLVSERERACDEEVVQMGTDKQTYAESILKVCGFCLRAPAAFAAGVAGSELARRIERIVTVSATTRRQTATPVVVAVLALALAAPAFTAGMLSAHGAAGQTVYKPGDDVKPPLLVKEVKPKYTREAMEAKVEGTVQLRVVVLDNGGIGDVEVTQSLDKVYGLDDEAVKAVRQWEFKPGTKGGTPVAVEVTIEMSFRLK